MNPRRSATRFPRKRFPISTRFQNVMNAFGVLAEKVLAEAGLSSEQFFMMKSTHNIGQEFVAACSMLDIDPEQVLKSAGLGKRSGNDGALFVTPKQITAVYEAFEAVSGRDDFHITLANGFAKGPFGNAFLAMQCSETLREGIYRAGRFKELFEPVEWKVSESRSSLSISVHSLTPDFLFGVKQQVLTSLSLVFLCRNVSARHIVPKRWCVTDACPHQERVEQQIRCPVELSSRALIEFDKNDMDIRILPANQYIVNGLDTILNSQQRHVPSAQGFVDLVSAHVLELLPSGELTSDRVATHLSISKRTLERRLSEQGSSFTQIVRDCRLRMAEHYLCQTSLSLNEIAFSLGFQDTTSFCRAFKGWSGHTPQEKRRLKPPSTNPAS
jgi:AraC-like DNA-binding protein